MKKSILVLLIPFLLFADRLSFDDLNMMLSAQYGKTIVIASSIKNDFMVYTNKLDSDFTLDTIRRITEELGFNYRLIGQIIYISEKSENEKQEQDLQKELFAQKHKNELERSFKQFRTAYIETNLKKDVVDGICELMTYKCIYLGNSSYLLASEIQDIDITLFRGKNRLRYQLQASIYSTDTNVLEENDINLAAILSYTKNIHSPAIGALNVLGNFGTEYRSLNGDNYSLDAILSFLEQKGLAKSVSRPTLSLSDSQEVVFISGDQIPIQSSTTTDAQTGNTITNYSNVDVGITLKVTPTFLTDSSVDLSLSLDISSLLQYDSQKNLASMTKKTLTGFYNIRLHEPIQLVQFSSSQENQNNSKTPFLSDLPYIGGVFSSDSSTENNKLLIITLYLLDQNTFKRPISNSDPITATTAPALQRGGAP